jgi:trans-aconitate 2-methyltransferase
MVGRRPSGEPEITMADDEQTYTFGDNDLAAERLRLLARAFEPTSRAFLTGVSARWATHHPVQQAVDLGCGPGHTTRLLREVLAPLCTTGVDRSKLFLARARLWQTGDLRFCEHDVTRAPLPIAGVDLLYARFLLTHLPHPGRVLAGWAQSAAPHATLLLEETAALTSSHPAMQRYYQLVAQMQRAHGQNMTVGLALEDLAGGTGWDVREARLTSARLPARLMSQIHVMNLRTWKHDRQAAALESPEQLDALDAQLEQLACGRETAGDVACQLKQVWLSRSPAIPDQPGPAVTGETAARPGC